MALTEERSKPYIAFVDIDSGNVVLKETVIIKRDGVELTRLEESITVDAMDDNDVQTKLASNPDELEYVQKLKQRKQKG